MCYLPVKVKVLDQRLLDESVGWGLPAYGTPGSAGLDLRACIQEPLVLEPHSKSVLVSSGLANDIATVITASFGVYGVYGSFIGIYLVTMILTEFMSNNSAAAIVFPIAYSTAIGLDASIYPFVFAVAFGASASFLIPHGYQTNLMVTSLGSYKTKDFIKAGIPLSIVYSLVVIIATPIFFKF